MKQVDIDITQKDYLFVNAKSTVGDGGVSNELLYNVISCPDNAMASLIMTSLIGTRGEPGVAWY